MANTDEQRHNANLRQKQQEQQTIVQEEKIVPMQTRGTKQITGKSITNERCEGIPTCKNNRRNIP